MEWKIPQPVDIMVKCYLLCIPASAFAAAGFADRYYEHQSWILHAYAYCLTFGLIFLLGLFLSTIHWKAKTRAITECISDYLKTHQVLAIIFTGISLAVPIGIMGAFSWEIISFLAIIPLMGLLIGFPAVLVNRRFREECLLSSFWIKWGIMISLSSFLASLLFVILTDLNLLAGMETTCLVQHFRTTSLASHPYDSMKEIWEMPLLFTGEIIVALIFYWLGVLNRCLFAKLYKINV